MEKYYFILIFFYLNVMIRSHYSITQKYKLYKVEIIDIIFYLYYVNGGDCLNKCENFLSSNEVY